MTFSQVIQRVTSAWRVYLLCMTIGLVVASGFLALRPAKWEAHAFYQLASARGISLFDGSFLVRYLKSEQFATPLLKEMGITQPAAVHNFLNGITVRVVSAQTIEVLAIGGDVSTLKRFLSLAMERLQILDLQFIDEQSALARGPVVLHADASSSRIGGGKANARDDLKLGLFEPPTRRPKIYGPELVNASAPTGPFPAATLLLGVLLGAAVASVWVFRRR